MLRGNDVEIYRNGLLLMYNPNRGLYLGLIYAIKSLVGKQRLFLVVDNAGKIWILWMYFSHKYIIHLWYPRWYLDLKNLHIFAHVGNLATIFLFLLKIKFFLSIRILVAISTRITTKILYLEDWFCSNKVLKGVNEENSCQCLANMLRTTHYLITYELIYVSIYSSINPMLFSYIWSEI